MPHHDVVQTESVRRRLLLVMMTCAVLVGSVSPPVAAEPAPLPVIAGRTTIHASGITGIRLHVPHDVGIRLSTLQLDVSDDTGFAWASMAHQRPLEGLCEFCPLYNAVFVRDSRNIEDEPYRSSGECSNHAGEEVGCLLEAGSLDLYFVTDGTLTLTIEIPELSGELELTASGEVEGFLERLPERCDPPLCGVEVHGGVTRSVGTADRPGYAAVFSYVHNDPDWDGGAAPSEGNTYSCAYPGYFHGPEPSPRAEDHPQGCDATPTTAEDVAEERWSPRPLLVGGPWVGYNGNGWSNGDVSFDVRGEQYLGFFAHRFSPLRGGRMGAWGWWLTSGIACPSGDFTAC